MEQALSDRPTILVANDPPTYREVLAASLAALYPGLRVVQAIPAALDAALVGSAPLLVVCSRPVEGLRCAGCAKIVLYPEGVNEAVLTIGETSWTLPNPQLADVLAAVDVALASADAASRIVAGVLIETRPGHR
jgi:hypothetical protein